MREERGEGGEGEDRERGRQLLIKRGILYSLLCFFHGHLLKDSVSGIYKVETIVDVILPHDRLT